MIGVKVEFIHRLLVYNCHCSVPERMARANLNIDSGLTSAFLAAQEESSPVRALRISIINEDIVLNSTIDREGSNQRDFNSIVGLLSEREAALILFCLTDGVATGKGRSWLFLAWVRKKSRCVRLQKFAFIYI